MHASCMKNFEAEKTVSFMKFTINSKFEIKNQFHYKLKIIFI